MASSVPHLRRLACNFLRPQPAGGQTIIRRWRGLYTNSGAVNESPYECKFGTFKVIATVFPFLYFGAAMSKNGAAFLEENDIFVPEDDDD